MKRITLAKALIVRSRLAGKISALDQKIARANAATIISDKYEMEKPEKIDFKENLGELLAKRKALVDLLIQYKMAISMANKDNTQQHRIFMISELKSEVTVLQTISDSSGVSGGYGEKYMHTFVQMTSGEVEKLIESKNKQIDAVQEDMEKFNWNTTVEVPEVN